MVNTCLPSSVSRTDPQWYTWTQDQPRSLGEAEDDDDDGDDDDDDGDDDDYLGVAEGAIYRKLSPRN